MNAYQDLQSERQIGMAQGNIPWYSIIRWCHLNGIFDPDNINLFVRYLRALENCQREYSEKKEKGRNGR